MNADPQTIMTALFSRLRPNADADQWPPASSYVRVAVELWQERSISEICYACGFGSSSHFSTEFRRFYGVTPREYRCG